MSKKFIISATFAFLLIALALIVGKFWGGPSQQEPFIISDGNSIHQSDGNYLNEIEEQEKTTTNVHSDLVTQITESMLDVSTWKFYKNDQLGFALKYPKEFSVQEEFQKPFGKMDAYPNRAFRYTQFSFPPSGNSAGFSFSIGVKNIHESGDIWIRPWRTGVPAGDFSRTKISLENVVVERWDLVYKSLETEMLEDGRQQVGESESSYIQLVWFCKPGGINWCDDFSIGNDHVAFVDVDGEWDVESQNWDNAKKLMNSMIDSVIFFDEE